jgi:hypothetical protein
MAATMTKIIKEMLPPDVNVARDTQDLLIECCVGQNFTIYDNFILTVPCLFIELILLFQTFFM